MSARHRRCLNQVTQPNLNPVNLEELAFTNHQLASMLKSGLPLEGALKQLCRNMSRGRLRRELASLESDLASGTPLQEALQKRRLPDFYRRMVQVGVRSNDLPSLLTLLGDYYQQLSLTWMRLKGLMVYPFILLLTSLGVSTFLIFLVKNLTRELPQIFSDLTEGLAQRQMAFHTMWAPFILLSLLTLLFAIGLASPHARRFLRWRLPGFRDAALAQIASALGLLVRSGSPLPEAIALLGQIERNSPAGRELTLWGTRLAEGITALPEKGRALPPLFFWLLRSGGEDLAEGCRRAAELYQARAIHRSDLLLYAALPISVLFLGVLVIAQFFPVLHFVMGGGNSIVTMLDTLGGF